MTRSHASLRLCALRRGDAPSQLSPVFCLSPSLRTNITLNTLQTPTGPRNHRHVALASTRISCLIEEAPSRSSPHDGSVKHALNQLSIDKPKLPARQSSTVSQHNPRVPNAKRLRFPSPCAKCQRTGYCSQHARRLMPKHTGESLEKMRRGATSTFRSPSMIKVLCYEDSRIIMPPAKDSQSFLCVGPAVAALMRVGKL